MKNYLRPNVEVIITDVQDVVCGSVSDTGMSVGNGGGDISNWYWNVSQTSGERNDIPS